MTEISKNQQRLSGSWECSSVVGDMPRMHVVCEALGSVLKSPEGDRLCRRRQDGYSVIFSYLTYPKHHQPKTSKYGHHFTKPAGALES